MEEATLQKSINDRIGFEHGQTCVANYVMDETIKAIRAENERLLAHNTALAQTNTALRDRVTQLEANQLEAARASVSKRKKVRV